MALETSARTIGDEVLEIRTDVLEVGLSHKNPTDNMEELMQEQNLKNN